MHSNIHGILLRCHWRSLGIVTLLDDGPTPPLYSGSVFLPWQHTVCGICSISPAHPDTLLMSTAGYKKQKQMQPSDFDVLHWYNTVNPPPESEARQPVASKNMLQNLIKLWANWTWCLLCLTHSGPSVQAGSLPLLVTLFLLIFQTLGSGE